jgi:hypothetical protein
MGKLPPSLASFRNACAVALGVANADASKAAVEAVVPLMTTVDRAGARMARCSGALRAPPATIAKVRAAGSERRLQSCNGSNAGTVSSQAPRQYHQGMRQPRPWHNKAIDSDAQVRPCAVAHSILVRRSFLRYTCAFPSFTPHKMLVNGTQLSRLAFFAALWRSPWPCVRWLFTGRCLRPLRRS